MADARGSFGESDFVSGSDVSGKTSAQRRDLSARDFKLPIGKVHFIECKHTEERPHQEPKKNGYAENDKTFPMVLQTYSVSVCSLLTVKSMRSTSAEDISWQELR